MGITITEDGGEILQWDGKNFVPVPAKPHNPGIRSTVPTLSQTITRDTGKFYKIAKQFFCGISPAAQHQIRQAQEFQTLEQRAAERETKGT